MSIQFLFTSSLQSNVKDQPRIYFISPSEYNAQTIWNFAILFSWFHIILQYRMVFLKVAKPRKVFHPFLLRYYS